MFKNPTWVVIGKKRPKFAEKLAVYGKNRRAAKAAAAEHSVAIAEHIATGVFGCFRNNDFAAFKIAFGAVHINGKLFFYGFYNIVFIHKKHLRFYYFFGFMKSF